MIRADLHIHTYYSDGKHSPAEIAKMAKENGVELLSITDHDTMEGLDEKRAAAEKEGLLFVPGWEISAYVGDLKVHTLGYGCERKGAYHVFYEACKNNSLRRAEDSLNKANAFLGCNVTMDDVLRECKREGPMHVMHVTRAFAHKLNADVDEMFWKCFAWGKPGYSCIGRPTPEEAIDVIHACGGIAVLAHPGRIYLEGDARKKLIDGLVCYGVDGIECTYSQHTASETEYFLAYASGHGLLKTGGSDFHAKEARRTIGTPLFYPDDELLAALKLRPSGSE